MKNPYKILGIAENASQEEIKSAYKKLVKQHHPDRGGSAEKFTQIQEAYDMLTKPQNHDTQRSGNPHSGFTGNSSGFGPFSFSFNGEDIFEQFFRGGSNSGNYYHHVGNDIEVEISITLNDAYRGTSHEIEYMAEKHCTSCSGKGYMHESDTGTCGQCRGKGYVNRSAGFMSLNQTCDKCGGAGKIVKSYCASCNGKGTTKSKKSVSVKIPAGIEENTRLKLDGYGHAGRDGSGDLYVVVRIKSHNIFIRKKHDLYCQYTISCIEAMIGHYISVPDILGNIIKLEIPAGTQPNTQFIKHGSGMSIIGSTRKGDLYIEIKLSIPKNLSIMQKKMLSELNTAISAQ